MTSILNQKVGGGHKLTGVASISEGIILKSGGTTIFGGDSSPCITTSYSIAAGDAVQFSATLGTELYAYVLGNNPYVLTIDGLLFNDSCDEGKNPVSETIKSFNDYKASKHTVVKATIGSLVFTSLLESINITGSSAQGNDIFTFRLVLKGINE